MIRKSTHDAWMDLYLTSISSISAVVDSCQSAGVTSTLAWPVVLSDERAGGDMRSAKVAQMTIG